MKRLLFLLLLAALLPACDRKPAVDPEAQRQADERRIAELRELEQRQAQNAANAQLDADRQKLADDQAALDAERKRLADEKAALQSDAQRAKFEEDERRLAAREAALRADEKRAAEARDHARAEPRDDRRDRQDQPLDSFYTALDPMGDWMEVEPYGYVWRPREAREGGWRPYTDGTWVYTDYGWTWKGNEPFGWATYHYGRWAQVRRVGWVWVPGSEWAPAWVSWRKSPDWVGWAPLPPEAYSGSGFNAGVDSYYDIGPASYNFVPVSRLGEATYRGVVVEPERNVTIVNQTVNVTRINYTKFENRTVIHNDGPDFQQINRESARPVQRLRLEREDNRDRVGNASNNIAGDTLRLLAPNIAPASRTKAPPARVQERVASPVIERGWGTGDQAATQATRTRFQREAADAEKNPARPAATTPPPVRREAALPPATPPDEPRLRDAATPARLPKTTPAPRREATPPPDAPATPAPRREITPPPAMATPADRPPKPPRPTMDATPPRTKPPGRIDDPMPRATPPRAVATPPARPAGDPADVRKPFRQDPTGGEPKKPGGGKERGDEKEKEKR